MRLPSNSAHLSTKSNCQIHSVLPFKVATPMIIKWSHDSLWIDYHFVVSIVYLYFGLANGE